MTETDHGPALAPETVARFMARQLQNDGGATVTLTTADWGILIGLAMLGQKDFLADATVDQIAEAINVKDGESS